MLNRKSRKKSLTDNEEINAKFNTPFVEPSGLVSDPIPKSKRPAKKLTETGELRFEELKNEVLKAAQEAQKETIEEADGFEEDIDLSLEDGILDSEIGNEPAVLLLEGVSCLGNSSLSEDASAPSADNGEAAPFAHETQESGFAVKSASIVEDELVAGKVSLPEDTLEDVPEEVDPWLQDILDEQKSKKDFSKYRGQFARLNDFAVPRSDAEALKNPSMRGATQKELDQKDDKGQEAVPAGLAIVNPEDVLDAAVDAVCVHPRELLTAAMYDDLINWSSRLARETPLFHRAFSTGNVASVCDVGCGSGRHSVLFAEWGLRVIGVEENAGMLKRARALAEESQESIQKANGEVSFTKGQLGKISQAVGPEKIESIVCVGDVLPRVKSLTALREALNDFAEALLPFGILVLEFTNHTRYLQRRERTTSPVVFDTTEGTKAFFSVIDYPAGSTVINADMLSLTCNNEGKWRVRSERIQNLFISPEGIERELLDAGFDVLEIAGDFNGKSLSPLEDESIIVVARRKRHRPRTKRSK